MCGDYLGRDVLERDIVIMDGVEHVALDNVGLRHCFREATVMKNAVLTDVEHRFVERGKAAAICMQFVKGDSGDS